MYPNLDCKDCSECTPTTTVVSPQNCPEGSQCVDFIGTNCVTYQGSAYTCGGITIAVSESLTSILNKILTAICSGGFVGATGPVGPAPTLTVTSEVEISTDLLPPMVTMTEPSPDVYNLAFRLPKGDKGDDGVTPNISVFSTTAGAPGSNPSVNVNPLSTATNVLLDFVIPTTNVESYVSNVALSGTNLNFTGVNSAYNGSVDLSSLIDVYTVTNGLTDIGSNTFRLGGALSIPTSIDTNDVNALYIGGNSGFNSTARLEVFNTSTVGGGPALRVNSANSLSLEVYTSSSSYAAAFVNAPNQIAINTVGKYSNYFQVIDDVLNNTKKVLALESRTLLNAAPSAGIGGYIEMSAPRLNNLNDLEMHPTSFLHSYWESVLNASYNSVFRIDGANYALGSSVQIASFKGNGEVFFHKYGVGNFTTGTPVYMLGVDANGKIIEVLI
jgi:hypothetical protein